ncbi:MAG: hypothetical protein ACP6IY_09355 [Promethearchaeia archaeon]
MEKSGKILLIISILLIIASILIGKLYNQFIGLNILLLSVGVLIASFQINSENYFISEKVIIAALMVILLASSYILLEINWFNPGGIIITLMAQIASLTINLDKVSH